MNLKTLKKFIFKIFNKFYCNKKEKAISSFYALKYLPPKVIRIPNN